MTRQRRRLGTLVAVTAGLLAPYGIADGAQGPQWREARTSKARLTVQPRKWGDDDPGLVQISGSVPGKGSYLVFVTARSPERSCTRFPPLATLDEGVTVTQGDFRTAADPYARAGRQVVGSKVRICGYLVRSRSAERVLRPIVVARAQTVGTPRHNPRGLVGAIILAALIGGGLLWRRVLRRSRVAAARRRALGGQWPPPPPSRVPPTRPQPQPPRPRRTPPSTYPPPARPQATSRTRPPPSSPGATRVCYAHKGKREFATEADAQSFVDWSQRREAEGTWTGQPMDHCYECPEVGGHWHVSKEPRRW